MIQYAPFWNDKKNGLETGSKRKEKPTMMETKVAMLTKELEPCTKKLNKSKNMKIKAICLIDSGVSLLHLVTHLVLLDC